MVPGARLNRNDRNSAPMIVWFEQGSSTKITRTKLDRVCRSRAQWPLEQGSTGMIGADDSTVT